MDVTNTLGEPEPKRAELLSHLRGFPYTVYAAVFYEFSIQSIEPRSDRFSLFGPSGCVVSGLTAYQSLCLFKYTSHLENRVLELDMMLDKVENSNGSLQIDLAELRQSLKDFFKDSK